MKTKNTSKKMCAICGGELRETTITHEERRGENLYLFQNVPAKACTAWGEIWIDEEALRTIDQLIQTGVPVTKIETPVFDFTRAGTIVR